MSASAERSEGTNPETGNHWTGTDRASKQRLEFSPNRNLADRRPADRGALGLPGESWLRAQLG